MDKGTYCLIPVLRTSLDNEVQSIRAVLSPKSRKYYKFFWPVEKIRYFLITSRIWAPNEITIFFLTLLKPRLDKSNFSSCQNLFALCFQDLPFHNPGSRTTNPQRWTNTVNVSPVCFALAKQSEGTEYQHIEIRFIPVICFMLWFQRHQGCLRAR